MAMKRRRSPQSPSIEDLPYREECFTPEKRRTKKPRTEDYLKQKAIYVDVLHSCNLFQTELSKLTSNASNIMTHPSRKAIVKSSENNIQRQVQKYKAKFHTKCQQLKQQAKQTIDLSHGFDCMTKAIGSNETSFLSVLNLGGETTSAITLRIAEYAGVASEDHLEDMKSLAAQLQHDGR